MIRSATMLEKLQGQKENILALLHDTHGVSHGSQVCMGGLSL